MKKIVGLLILNIFLIASCAKDERIEKDCIAKKLDELNMIEFAGQDLSCNFFLEIYSFKNKEYFLLGNHCVDMVSYPEDCEGKKLCENDELIKCENFFNNSQRIGIVGIRE